MQLSDSDRVEVVYDKECPICEFYCQRIDIRESAGELVRVDARDDSEIMSEISALGLDIDEGMVVRVGDELHYGADAIHELAKLGTEKDFVNNAARLGFGSRRVARLLYPFFKFLRNLLLKMLGRSRINNLQQPDNDRF